MRLWTMLKASVGRRARYRETVAALRAMPLDVALDLDIYRGDAEKLAHKAVYGGRQPA